MLLHRQLGPGLAAVARFEFREFTLLADAAGDGVIHPHEWRALVSRCPAVAAFMTLPALANVTTKYPSFVLRSRH